MQGFKSETSRGITGSLQSVGDTITGILGKGFKVGAAAGIAALGTSIVKGFSRLKGIDEARFKLQGLGHDADAVDAIMSNALDSVRGTAFGLDEAATIAASAVAAGIDPGDALTRTLTLTGDAAAIAGSSLGDMGSIFGKVAASNRMMTEEMNQLQDRGIPVLQYLQDEFGITADAAREMVSNGEVDFATFEKIIEENIGGAAMTMGGSWSGALANMGAAAARFGARLIGPIFEQSKGWFVGITGWIDDLTDKIGPLADEFGERLAHGIERLSNFMSDKLIPALETAVGWFNDNRDAIQRVAEAVAPAVGIIAGLATSISLVTAAFKILAAATPIGLLLLLVSGLIYAWQNSETFRDIVTTAFETVQRVIGTVVDWVTDKIEWFKGLFSSASGVVSDETSWIGQTLEQLQGIFATVFTIIGEVWDIFSSKVETVLTVVREHIEIFTGWAMAIWDVFGDTIMDIVGLAWGFIQDTITNVLTFIQALLDTVLAVIRGDWGAAWQGMKDMFAATWEQIKNVFTTAWNVLMTWFTQIPPRVIKAIRPLIARGMAWGLEVMGSIRTAFSDRWNSLLDWFSAIPARVIVALVTMLAKGKKWAREVIDGMKESFIERWDSVMTWFREIPQRIRDAIPNPLDILKNAGRQIISGFLSGINERFENVRNRLSDLTSMLPDWKGPASVDKTILRDSGQMVMEGFQLGLEDRFGDIQGTLRSLTGTLSVPAPGFTSVPSVSAAKGNAVHIENYHATEKADIDLLMQRAEFALQSGRL